MKITDENINLHYVNSIVEELDRELYPDAETVAGVDFGDIGRGALGGVHLVGKPVAGIFGLGGVTSQLETLETKYNLLPDWAGAADIAVAAPDYIVLVRDKPQLIKAPKTAAIFGGKRFDGNGYTSGSKEPLGDKFSFGVESPTKVDIKDSDGHKQFYNDVRQIIFLGGSETRKAGSTVAGDDDLIDRTDDGFVHKDLREINEILGIDEDAALIALNVFTGGMASPAFAGRDFMKRKPDPYAGAQPMTLKSQAQDYKQTDEYKSAVSRLEASRAANAAMLSKLQAVQSRQPSSAPVITPTMVPDLSRSFDMGFSTDGSTVAGEDAVYGGDELAGAIDDVLGHGHGGQIADSDWSEVVGDDYALGCHVLGAPLTTRAEIVGKIMSPTESAIFAQTKKTALDKHRKTTTQRGKGQFVGPPTGKRSPHKRALARTLNAANKALRAGVQATKRADIAAHATQVKGWGGFTDIVGANLTSAQKTAVDKHKKAQSRHADAVVAARKAGKKAKEAAVEAAAAHKKAQPVINVLLAQSSKGPRTVIHGDFDEIVGAMSRQERAEFVQFRKEVLSKLADLDPRTHAAPSHAAPFDPNARSRARAALEQRVYNPLSHVVGDFDEICGDDGALTSDFDEILGALTSDFDELLGDGEEGDAGPPLPGAATDAAPADASAAADSGGDIPLPTRGAALDPESARVVYTQATFPDDGVIYQSNLGVPLNAFGSWNVFFGEGGAAAPGFQYVNLKGKDTWAYRGPEDVAKEAKGKREGQYKWHVLDKNINTPQQVHQKSLDMGFGPLVGNPSMDLKGLQYAPDKGEKGTWFWQSDIAPVWATKPQDDAIRLLNKKTKEADDAAAAADAKRVALEQAQMNEDKAKQDAAIALASDKAKAEAAITQGKLDQQQQIADAQAAAASTALDLQSQKQGLAQQAAGAAREAAESAFDLKTREADLAYAVAHPEVAQQEQAVPEGEEGEIPMDDSPPSRGAGSIEAFDRSSSDSSEAAFTSEDEG